MMRQPLPLPVLLLVAVLVPSSSALCAQTPVEKEVIAAEESLEQARLQSKQRDAAVLLDDNAREVAADGNLATGGRPQVPVLASRRLGIRIYKDVAIVTSSVRLPTAEAHVLRIWVRMDTGWRLLVSQQTALAPHLRQSPTTRVPLARLVDEDDAESAGILEAEHARLDARHRKDIAQYATLLGDDYAGIDSTGLYRTKIAEADRQRLLEARTPHDLDVRIVGPVAVVLGFESVWNPNHTMEGLMRFTRVWVRRAGRYECVAEQSTTSTVHP
jgi:hypothetical protein